MSEGNQVDGGEELHGPISTRRPILRIGVLDIFHLVRVLGRNSHFRSRRGRLLHLRSTPTLSSPAELPTTATTITDVFVDQGQLALAYDWKGQ